MASGEHSLQAHAFFAASFNSQYRYALALSTIHTRATSVSTEAKMMVFTQSPNGLGVTPELSPPAEQQWQLRNVTGNAPHFIKRQPLAMAAL